VPDFSDEAVGEAKADLRATLLARRRSLSAPARQAAAERIQAELAALVRRLRPAGRLLLPVLRPDLGLDWAPYRGPKSLVAAGRGMREPAGGRLGPAAIGAAGLVVVPAVAVDLRGMRLGRGGGSYDRALARVGAGTLVVALLHDGELIDSVPTRDHDRPVHGAITPTGGLRVLAPG